MAIIIRPIITEKSIADVKSGFFTFEAEKKAGKFEIRKEIEKMFNVHVKSISTSAIKGKKRFAGRKRKLIYDSDSKKARVRLATGEKIDLFEVGDKK